MYSELKFIHVIFLGPLQLVSFVSSCQAFKLLAPAYAREPSFGDDLGYVNSRDSKGSGTISWCQVFVSEPIPNKFFAHTSASI